MNTHYNATSQVEALSYVLNTLIQSSAKESEGCVRHVRQKELLISIQLTKKLLQQAEELAMMEAEFEALFEGNASLGIHNEQ